MNSPMLKGIIVPLIFIGVLGYFGYVLFIKTPEPNFEVVQPGDSLTVTESEISALIERLNNLSVDQTIFSSKVFTSLKDFGTVLMAEPQGRANPFLSIGLDGGSQ